jgi:alkanesulfonate monooxygenase SsuD/methylene tetrahydromethanopterin reductase-like flavin-dependent oxidoreductase (luciferase family)
MLELAAVAYAHVNGYLRSEAYRANWLRLGFTDDDFASGASQRLVDALVAYGDAETIARRVQEHRDAGADHVCIQALEPDTRALPMSQWRSLASVLTE